MERKIQSIEFIPFALHYKAVALLDDGCTSHLFSYYPDELEFTAEEFVGLSVREALALYEKKDKEYLDD